MENYLETTRHTMKQILHGHLQYAQLMGRSLRDHLEIICRLQGKWLVSISYEL